MKLKTHKAFSKRVKITGSGKMMKRRAGQDHFNSRDTGKIGRNKRKDIILTKTLNKAAKNLIPKP